MYEISIQINKTSSDDDSDVCDNVSCPHCRGDIRINDEPIKCSNCCREIFDKDADKLFELLEKGKCKTCLRLEERIKKASALMEKKNKQITDLQWKLYLRKLS